MKHLPNALTLTNLFFGCCALLYTLAGDPVTAAFFTLGSFICDYADGMAARALGVHSPLGKELDSLADVISFGVVPGAMIYMMIRGGIGHVPSFSSWSVMGVALPAFILSAFSALRLAKFNLDTRQANYFIGLSTPACTVFVLGLTLAVNKDRFGLAESIGNQWFLYGLIALLSWLLISEIPMFGLKIKKFDLKSNAPILGFLALFAVLILLLKELALSAIIVCYIVLSIVFRNRIVAT